MASEIGSVTWWSLSVYALYGSVLISHMFAVEPTLVCLPVTLWRLDINTCSQAAEE